MFVLWHKPIFRNLFKQTYFKTIWMEIPKFISWEIWLARNKATPNSSPEKYG
jgi:hypothetical protein